MTASEEPEGRPVDEESSGDDDDESVPSGEEEIDELGRNPTQRRMAERGEPPVE